ncbi:hypothetical protein [Curtobacterium sp. Leaf261]|uniref:hypothetical protein n=1 Tax=Curtobacterium sp. Leaf261 TaxID=1736311 RepID=UPI0006F1DB66|nr:hypothetical protein [Curtobacterium sp. Leaf261]KQO62334.1 hypothetical protein ASF23_11095 [Curtobacterium sp. Leaf261]
MSSATPKRDLTMFRWGVVALIVLGLAVFTPLAAAFGNASTYFFIEMMLIAALVAWYESRRRQRR